MSPVTYTVDTAIDRPVCVVCRQSANGTYLSEQRLPSHQWQPLLPGQEVGFGGPEADEPELFVFAVLDVDPREVVSEGHAAMTRSLTSAPTLAPTRAGSGSGPGSVSCVMVSLQHQADEFGGHMDENICILIPARYSLVPATTAFSCTFSIYKSKDARSGATKRTASKIYDRHRP